MGKTYSDTQPASTTALLTINTLSTCNAGHAWNTQVLSCDCLDANGAGHILLDHVVSSADVAGMYAGTRLGALDCEVGIGAPPSVSHRLDFEYGILRRHWLIAIAENLVPKQPHYLLKHTYLFLRTHG